MNLFLHEGSRVRIVTDTAGWQEWQGTLTEFLALEPAYPGLPAGMTIRYQTLERQYVSNGDDLEADAFNALPYCENLDSYPAWTMGSDGVLPVGAALLWFAAAAPPGWYLADGQAVAESLPVGQWALSIGQASNGNGTVNVPNLKLKFPFMAGSGYNLKSIGGASSAWVFDTHLPSSVKLGNMGLADSVELTESPSTETRRFANGEIVGGATPHNNMPPYYCVNFIIWGG